MGVTDVSADSLGNLVVVTGSGGTALHRPDSEDPEQPRCLAKIKSARRVEARKIIGFRPLCRRDKCFGGDVEEVP